MLNGEFPPSYVPGRSSLESPVPLIRDRVGVPGRREWLLGAAAFLAGAGATAAWHGVRAGEEARVAAGPGEPAERGSVQWALRLLLGPPEELLHAAGDVERVTMRYRDDGRLVPCLQRLLDLSLEREHPVADQAGACAVRSLGRMGRGDLLQAAASRLETRLDRPRTKEALQSSLEKLRLRRPR